MKDIYQKNAKRPSGLTYNCRRDSSEAERERLHLLLLVDALGLDGSRLEDFDEPVSLDGAGDLRGLILVLKRIHKATAEGEGHLPRWGSPSGRAFHGALLLEELSIDEGKEGVHFAAIERPHLGLLAQLEFHQVVLERGGGVYLPLVAVHGHIKERLQVGGGRARDQAHADLLQVFHIVHRFYQQPLPFERRCCGKSCFSGGALCMQRSQGEEDEGEGNR
uniref:Uncharacterized protein n=1 Tax=Steinernema glaseri TaxID=37863 RepID=A0A1I7ZAD9_9BILA